MHNLCYFHQDRTLALRAEGSGIVLDSDLPHLIGVDDDLLSTGLVMYHIKVCLTKTYKIM